MASLATLQKLSGLVDSLEIKYSARKACVAIQVPYGMNADEVSARHFKIYPEDARADQIVFLMTYLQNPESTPAHRCNEAWRQIAQEEEARLGRDAALRLRGKRIIANELKLYRDNPNLETAQYAAGWCASTISEFGIDGADVMRELAGAGIPLTDPAIKHSIERELGENNGQLSV